MKIADLKPIFFPTKIEPVDKKLYRGNAVFSPIKALRLKEKGITQVIDLRHENNFLVKTCKFLEKLYLNILGIKYMQIDFWDGKNEFIPNLDFFENLNKQINSNDKTYIHCHYGIHRTGLAVAMYEKSKGFSDETIINHLKEKTWKNKQSDTLKRFIQKHFPNVEN